MGPETARATAALRKFAGAAVRTLVFELTHELVRETPVDTGHARSNWVPTKGYPNQTRWGSKAAVTYAAVTQGLGMMYSYVLDHVELYITNVVPYIVDLEGGYSPQKPSGFVHKVVPRVVNRVQALFGRFRL